MRTAYSWLMCMKEMCERRSLEYMNKNEESLAKFWKNAAIGYEMRARKVELKTVLYEKDLQ